MDGFSSSDDPCYSFCGKTNAYTVSCLCLISINSLTSALNICEGTDGDILVSASIGSPVPSGASLEYQWQVDSGSGYSNVADTDTALNLTNVTNAMNGNNYRVIITMDVNGTDVCSDTSAASILTVFPKSILSTMLDTTVCSDEPSGIVFSTSGGGPLDYYIIDSVTVAPGLTGTPTTGNNLAANAISGDYFTNITNGDLTVVYHNITVSTQGCFGDTIQVTLTIKPKPSITDQTESAVCSDDVIGGVTYGTSSGIAAASFDITGVNANGLTQSAGTSSTTDDDISDDAWTNTGSSVVNVIYTVVPTSANGCSGDAFTVTIPIEPHPTISNQTENPVCSSVAINTITFGGSGGVSASSFDITAVDSNGLTQVSGNPSVADDDISDDAWLNDGSSTVNVIYTVVPSTSAGCTGSSFTVTVPIRPEPSISDQTESVVCGDAAIGSVTYGSSSGVSASTFDITAVNSNGLSQSAGTSSITDDDISDDAWTNTGSGAVNVVYTIVPSSSDGCAGASFTVTVPIDPEPLISDQTESASCSDVVIGTVTYGISSGVAASAFDITAVNSNGLTQSAGISSVTDDDISDDAWTNTTSAVVNVEYIVVPSSAAGCNGNSFTVTAPIDPEPVISNQTESAVCSDAAIGSISYGASSGATAGSFDITAVNSNGLTQSAGTSSVADDNISDDAWTNTTSGAVNVVYTVVPSSAAGCDGASFTVTIPIDPEPVIADQTEPTVCSQTVIGTVTYGTSSSVAATNFDITAVNSNGLTQSLGVESTSDNDISDDAWINSGGGVVNVIYTVVPASANGCAGASFTVTVPIDPAVAVEAGSSPPICSNGAVDLTSLGASITGAVSTGQWTSGTGGTFDKGGAFGGANPATTYTPSNTDKMAGQVTLTLTSQDPSGNCSDVSDIVVITINNVECGSFPWGGN